MDVSAVLMKIDITQSARTTAIAVSLFPVLLLVDALKPVNGLVMSLNVTESPARHFLLLITAQ